MRGLPATAMLGAALCSTVILSDAKAEDQSSATPKAATQLEAVKVDGDWLGDGSQAAVKTYPGARNVLAGPELHQSGARNLEDALRQVPGVHVQDETGAGLLPNIGVRGLNPTRSERALVLVDGVPVALGPYTGTGLSLFPLTSEMIDRIDVVRGGAAVRYGPNNVGGVINFLTNPIPTKTSYTAREQLSIADKTGNILTDTYLRAGGFVTPDLGLQAQYNVIAGDSWRQHSATEVHNIQLNGQWFATDQDEVKASAQYYYANADLPGALTPSVYESDRTRSQRPYDAFTGKTWRGTLSYSHYFGDDGEFNWTNFGHVSDREFTFSAQNNPSAVTTAVSTSPRKFVVGGTEPRFTWQAQTGPVSHKFTVGGRYVRENVDFIVDTLTLSTGRSVRARNWRFDTNGYAAYTSDTLGFLNDRIKITPGVRYERVDTDFRDRIANVSSSNRSQEALPGLDIGVQVTDGLFAFANAHKSLRVPQVAQVTRGGAVGAEVAWDYEIGTRITPADGVETTLTAFRIDFDNQIEFDSASQLYRNLGKTRHQGVEIEAGWKPAMLPGVHFKTSYTYVNAEQLSGTYAGNQVPYSSRHQVSLSGGYGFAGYDLNVTGNYESAAFSDAANTVQEDVNGAAGRLPSYWLWNMQLTKEIEVGKSRLTAAAAVNNIFNEDYYFRGVDTSPVGRVPGPGRTFLVSLRSDF